MADFTITLNVSIPDASAIEPDEPPIPAEPTTPTPRGRGLMNFRLPWEFDTHTDGTIGVNQWTERIGSGFAALQYGQFWVESSGKPTPFYAANASKIWDYGAVPVINWCSWKQGGGAVQPDFSAERIVAGDWDSLIDAYADGARAWATDGRRLVIRFNHEMNMTSGQFPWQPNREGNAPAQFAQAWTHVVERFYARECGPPLVNWFWCPGQASSTHDTPLDQFWPGSEWVQIVGADCYNYGSPYVSLSQAFRGEAWGGPDYIFDTYAQIMALAGASALPFWIGETGTVDTADDGIGRAMWWQQAVDELDRAMPACRCVLWYDDIAYPQSRISGDAGCEAAFVRANQHALMHGDRARLP